VTLKIPTKWEFVNHKLVPIAWKTVTFTIPKHFGKIDGAWSCPVKGGPAAVENFEAALVVLPPTFPGVPSGDTAFAVKPLNGGTIVSATIDGVVANGAIDGSGEYIVFLKTSALPADILAQVWFENSGNSPVNTDLVWPRPAA
jgi:hypothetical protein